MSADYAVEKNVVVDDSGVNERMDKAVLREAAAADEAEHKMTIAQGWKSHKKVSKYTLGEAFKLTEQAILWSMALSAALIMEGYDVVSSSKPQCSEHSRYGIDTCTPATTSSPF